jgi:HK97 family phage major capsid protein
MTETTADRIARTVRENSGTTPRTGTLGERAVREGHYLAAVQRDAVGRDPVQWHADHLTSAAELRAALTTSTGSGLLVEQADRRVVDVAPLPSRVPALVRTVVLDKRLVKPVTTTTYLGGAGGTPDGAASPEINDLSLSADEFVCEPWSVAGTMPRNMLDDRGYTAEVIDTLFRQEFWRSLEADIINGDGSETAASRRLTGILTDPGIGTLARGTQSRLDALAEAVETVQNADHYDNPLTVAASPTTLRRIRTEKEPGSGGVVRLREALPDVAAYVPVPNVPDGTALLGDFSAAVLFLVSGLTLEGSDTHGDFFVNGRHLLRLSADMEFRVQHPDAFVSVTNV